MNAGKKRAIFLICFGSLSFCCRVGSASDVAAAAPIGQPSIYWHEGQWQTWNDGVWTPYGQKPKTAPAPFGSSNGALNRHGGRNRTIGKPTIGIGQPTLGIGQPNTTIGQPTPGMGQPTIGIGQPSGGLGQPTIGIGKPAPGIGQNPVAIGQPTIGIGKPTIGIGKPTIGIGQPTTGIGKPTIGIGKPTEFHSEAIKSHAPYPARTTFDNSVRH